MNRVHAYIDSNNLNLGIKYQGWELDYKRFRTYLKDKYNVKKAYLFIGEVPGQRKLYNSLKKAGFTLIMRPKLIHERRRREVQQGMDLELIMHALINFMSYDKAIIVSGSGNVYCLIDYLVKRNKLEKLIVPNKSRYSTLLNFHAANRMDFMNNLQNKLEYKKNER